MDKILQPYNLLMHRYIFYLTLKILHAEKCINQCPEYREPPRATGSPPAQTIAILRVVSLLIIVSGAPCRDAIAFIGYIYKSFYK